MPHPDRRSSQLGPPLSTALLSVGLLLATLLPFVPAKPRRLEDASFASGERAAISAAHSARTISLSESGQLHLTSKHGFTLNEQGPASGTVTGTIDVHLRIISTSRVTAEVSISPHGGSISGTATASYHRGNATANFSGTLSISRGTGSYDHAHGSGLSFSGTIERSNDAIDVHVSGEVTE
jgi:hypothetical protein